MAKQGRFVAWLEAQGDSAVADALGVTRQAVSYWRTGVARPDPNRLVDILQLAGGSLLASDIYPQKTPKPRGTK